MQSVTEESGAGSSVQVGPTSYIPLSGEVKNLPPLTARCENCNPVPFDLLGTSFRVFRDRTGQCWWCHRTLTCDHAVVMGDAICSCRVRSSQIREAMA